MIEYLQPKDGPVIAGLEGRERVFAKEQPEYIPLRTLVGVDSSGPVLSRWSPTAAQRAMIQQGKDIFLELLTFHTPLQPILMFVAGDEDAEEIKAAMSLDEPRPA